jgi:chaperone BCS1
VRLEFRLAGKDIITRLFCVVFKASDGDGPGPDQGKRVEDNKTVERLAMEFAAKMPKLEFSPAEILSFLVVNKQSPSIAVDNVVQWMTKIREERKKAKNERQVIPEACGNTSWETLRHLKCIWSRGKVALLLASRNRMLIFVPL